MAKYGIDDIRNVAFVGAAHSGKTTLIEALLHKAGAIGRRGNVADGSSFVDYDPDERDKKHSLVMKLFHCSHQKREINLLDTPGYPDYVGEALAAMWAVETVVVCLSAIDGVTYHCRKLYTEAAAAGRGRVLVVNRIDADTVDLHKVVEQIQEAFGHDCVPLNLPISVGPAASGVVNLLDGYESAPAHLKALVERSHEQLIDSLVSLDDKAMEKYLETGEAALDDLIHLLEEGIAHGKVTPILFTAATKDIGVAELLNFLAEDLPTPVQGPFFTASEGAEPGGKEIAIDPSHRKEFAARVFKTVADPYVGRMTFLRVLAGEIKLDDLYLNPRHGKPEKMVHIFRQQGKDQEKIDHAVAGDIVVLAKAETVDTNDTLCAERAPIHFAPMPMPKPMVALAVAPKSRNDEQKLSTGLRKLTTEDLTFTVDRDSQTAELIVHGVSNLHVETLLHRLAARFKVEVETKIPKVPLRETIAAKAEGHHRHKKQSGGRGQFGEVYLRIAPNERGKGFEFRDETFGGSIPRQFLPAIEKGVVEQAHRGVVAGYPVVDFIVSVYDGKYHDVDSDEASFKIAGARAFKDAFSKARPILLEPVVDLEVAVPSRYMGEITSDMNGRRGRISGMDTIGDTQVIKAQVPLKEIQSYAPDLRSMTQGQGGYTFAFSHYDVVPHKTAEDMMNAFKAGQKPDED